MFGCWLYLEVNAKDGEATYSKYVELPFVPTRNMRLIMHEEHYDVFDIERVEYSFENDVFWVYSTLDCIDSDCPCKPGDRCCVLNHEPYFDDGWELESARRGYDRRIHNPAMFDPDKWIMTEQ